MPRLLIEGPSRLQGRVRVSGSKNAALPIIAASLLVPEPVTLTNVPKILDVERLFEVLREFGATVERSGNDVKIDASAARFVEPSAHIVKHMRASILLVAPLLARFGEAKMAYPGGCVIGKRSIGAHEQVLVELGAEIVEDQTRIHFRTKGLKAARVSLQQVSVTATENAVMAAVTTAGETEIRLAAAEPHVADLCNFLVSCGAKIEGIGTHVLTVTGVERLHGATHRIRPDYIEAGTWAIAGVLTQSILEVEDIIEDDLDALWVNLRQAGARFSFEGGTLKIQPPFKFKELPGPWVDTGIFPMFPTDLQAPFAVLLTQLPGVTKVFEKMFEGRLAYMYELEKMGAHVEVINPHQALVIGPTPLHAAPVASMDLRAGFAMVLAALVAQGTTEISNIDYIDRGYEDVEGKLRALGVKVTRLEDGAGAR